MLIIEKIVRYLRLINHLLYSFKEGITVSSLFSEILLSYPNKRFFRKSFNIKLEKKFLIKSIQSYFIAEVDKDEILKSDHFSEKLKVKIEMNIKSTWKNIIFLKHSMLYHHWFGSLVNSQYLRNLYRKHIITYQEKENYICFSAAQAALEENRLTLIETWFKKKRISKLDNDLLRIFNNYLKIISRKYSFNEHTIKSPMLDLIKNKKVIILGPAEDKEFNNKNYKNNYDISVMVNYLHGRDLKPDISYYGQTLKKTNEELTYKSINDLKYACIFPEYLKLKKFSQIKSLNVKGIDKDLRSLMINFRTRPNLIQEVVFDLLKNNPKKIYLCGINFYLVKKIYRDRSYSKYFINEKKNKSVIENLRGSHDLFSNFMIIKNLWKNGLIDVSNDVEKLISLSEIEYANKLEMSYGTFL